MKPERIGYCFAAFCMLIVLTAACTLSRSASRHANEQGPTGFLPRSGLRPVSVSEIEGYLAQVTPWLEHILPWPDYATNYPKTSWEALVSAAVVMQRGDPQLVESALCDYQRIHDNGARNDDSKLLLLMRVAFDLPETRPLEHGVWFGGWRDLSGSDNMKTNAAWPISWNSGKPILVVGFTLFEGQRYDAGAEFRYFVRKYPARNLALFYK